MGRRIARAFAVAAALAVTGALAVPASGGTPPGAAPGEVRVTDLAALESTIARYRGQGLLVNFWASWCEPCIAELPELVDVARQFEGKGLVVLTVSYDLLTAGGAREETVKDVGAFVEEQKVDLPVLIYDGPDEGINERFGLPGAVPVTIAIDRDGEVVGRHVGRATREHFGALVRRALGSR